MLDGLLNQFSRRSTARSFNLGRLQEASEFERRLMDLCSHTVQDALKALETGPRGLSSQEAERRLEEFGPNCYPRLRLDPLIAVNRTHFSVVGTIESAPVFEPTSHD